MSNLKKIFIIVMLLICLFSAFILVSSIINLAQKQYLTGSFYTKEGLIILIVISSLIFLTSVGIIIFQFKKDN